MDHHHHPTPAKKNPWKFRIRIVTLLAMVTLGLGTAAVERWRAEEFSLVWGRFHEKIFTFINPLSQRAYRLVSVAVKVDRLMKVEDEKKQLARDVSKLHTENQVLAEKLSRLNRLAGLGQWSGPADLMFISADVSGLITGGQSAMLIINRGQSDGVRPHDAVVALGGLVGIVQTVAENSATVQSITDSVSNVGVMDRLSRARGVVMGRGRNALMEFMPENEVQPINSGGVLITSGFPNSVFPKGVIVGVIQSIKLNTYGIPYGEVKPMVSFETLEEVLLVIPRHRLTGQAEPTTATLGSKRIFMPGASLSEDLPDTVTTPALAPVPILPVAPGTTTTLAITGGTSATLNNYATSATLPAAAALMPVRANAAPSTLTVPIVRIINPTPAPKPAKPAGRFNTRNKSSAPRGGEVGPGDFGR